MKYISLSILFTLNVLALGAQINGNGKTVTVTHTLNQLESIDVQLNAEIILDTQLEEKMTITAEENIIEWIGIKFINNCLTLDQVKWIEPSKTIKITIGIPELLHLYQGTHSKTVITNLDSDYFTIEGNVGKVSATGKVKNLTVNTTGTDIDLSKVEIISAFINIDDSSEVKLDKVTNLKTNLNKRSRLKLLSKPENYDGNLDSLQNQKHITENKDLRFIKFKVKNNSFKRKHFEVVGPKKDGSTFSYGFSLLPQFTKNKNWSTGSKVYEIKRSGKRELLVTIKAEDEGKTVDLFM